ncbi:MAG: ATP-dependent Clp protease adaptor ClpS [Candidatus Moduliflexus flocculans]|nr:ATP-dependent Clp protease adaptor ClpS [Candidatus Moduliflexus flocculans]
MEESTEGEVLVREDEEIQDAEEFRAILLNDDYTTMEFVVAVHHDGLPQGPGGGYADHARRAQEGPRRRGRRIPTTSPRTKVSQVHTLARENGFPLKCTMEKA